MGNVFSIQISGDAIFSRCLDCMGERGRYIHQLEDNLHALQTELQKLLETRDDLMRKVNVAEKKLKKPTHQVQGWLSRVQDAEGEAGKLLKVESQELDKLCVGGYCSKNCKSSYRFGKKVAKTLQVVTTLKGEGGFEVVGERVEEGNVDEIPLEPTIVGLESTFAKVWRFLGEEQAGVIGLFGPGGVGKTTLLKKIHNSLCSDHHDFKYVIWAVASKEPNLEMIQEEIGKKIGIFDESWKIKIFQDKAQDIFNILTKKRFILLLDDLWKRIDLTAIGVPRSSSKATSKIIFTTRSLDVCGTMNADECLRVYCLGEEEAWKLFHHNLQRDVLDSHPDFLELAKTVAKECGGLPLALITVSRAMSCKKTPEEWRYAIHVLRNSAHKFADIETEVYHLLKFSYDSLPNDTIRSCLLYCSLFPEDYKIPKRELVDCWIGEEFLDGCNGSEVYDQGYDNIGVLVRACLLEEEEEEKEEEEGQDVVKMHDVVRDMALWITRENENKKDFFVQAGIGLTEAPEVEKWGGVRRMSLMGNKIESLPEAPTCPNLQTLFLNRNRLRMIKNDFFQSMPSLKVLNLSFNFSLEKFPLQISNLVSLQYLNLSKTGIKELPIELKALVNLKCLSLEYTQMLCIIPRQLISNFSKLHVLRMYLCGFLTDEAREDNVLCGNDELLVEELVGLKYLNVLTISLKTSNALQRFFNSVKLRSCTQSLSLHHKKDSLSFNVSALTNLKRLNVSALTDLKLLHTLSITGYNLEELKIENVQKTLLPFCFHSLRTVKICFCKLKELTWLVFAPNLKFLDVNQCYEMEEIISVGKLSEVGEMMSNLNPFSKLRLLRLSLLFKLKSIYWKALPFPHLKQIVVFVCPMLKKLPLDSNSAKEHKISIHGQEEWWTELQWEDEATLNAFLPCFESLDD